MAKYVAILLSQAILEACTIHKVTKSLYIINKSFTKCTLEKTIYLSKNLNWIYESVANPRSSCVLIDIKVQILCRCVQSASVVSVCLKQQCQWCVHGHVGIVFKVLIVC